ncbi:hypothetical protein CAP35_06185 [Chitinophagaceae bacterium IBVUCB1]|nr:hypothetical protein CAP35_06185 [Chitinophagaceae bacterium IBVUCB1]
MKQYKILFSPHALNDIEQATQYYNHQQDGLGKRFASEVLKAIESIKKNPALVSVRYDDIRCIVVKKFPFMIHYAFDEKLKIVTIYAVYSTYREPLW